MAVCSLPHRVDLHDGFPRPIGPMHRVVDLYIKFTAVILPLLAMEDSLHFRAYSQSSASNLKYEREGSKARQKRRPRLTLRNKERVFKHKYRLLPMRRRTRRSCTKAHNSLLPFTSVQALSPLQCALAPHWPHLRNNGLAFLDVAHLRTRRDSQPRGGEESVEVKHKGGDLGPSVGGRNEGEGGREVELTDGYVFGDEVL